MRNWLILVYFKRFSLKKPWSTIKRVRNINTIIKPRKDVKGVTYFFNRIYTYDLVGLNLNGGVNDYYICFRTPRSSPEYYDIFYLNTGQMNMKSFLNHHDKINYFNLSDKLDENNDVKINERVTIKLKVQGSTTLIYAELKNRPIEIKKVTGKHMRTERKDMHYLLMTIYSDEIHNEGSKLSSKLDAQRRKYENEKLKEVYTTRSYAFREDRTLEFYKNEIEKLNFGIEVIENEIVKLEKSEFEKYGE